MGITLVTLAVVVAGGWLALSVYLGIVETEAALLHADYVKCPSCGRHYFAGRGTDTPHACATGPGAHVWRVLSRPVRHRRETHRAA